jgi:hypothetical protein
MGKSDHYPLSTIMPSSEYCNIKVILLPIQWRSIPIVEVKVPSFNMSAFLAFIDEKNISCIRSIRGKWSLESFYKICHPKVSNVCAGKRMRRIHSPPTYILPPPSKDWTNKRWLVKAAKGDLKQDEILITVWLLETCWILLVSQNRPYRQRICNHVPAFLIKTCLLSDSK